MRKNKKFNKKSKKENKEINFHEKLLKDATEGDLFVYKNGKYKKK